MFLTVGRDKLFYQDVGQGAPIVLIPGLGTTHHYFKPLTDALQQTYRVLAVDLRGVGQSESSTHDYSMEDWADDVAQVMEHAGVNSAHIIGSSLGGCVAQVFACRHQAKTTSLILSATFSEISPMLELNYRFRMDLIRQTGMSDLFVNLAITSLFGRTFYATEKGRAASATVAALIRSNRQDTYLEHLEAVLKFGRCEPGQDRADTFTQKLRDFRKPALVLVGEEDVLTVPAYSRILADAIPGATLIEQPRCGHLNLMEQPEHSSRAILNFLSNIDPGESL
jgi:pimeloyl-ACP methyl ester carboxylesterase